MASVALLAEPCRPGRACDHYSGVCHGTLGELFQGPYDHAGSTQIAIISLPIRRYSWAHFEAGPAGDLATETCDRPRCRRAIADALAGSTVAELLADARLPVRIAALDAYLAGQAPHDTDPRAERVMLPFGDPPTRAVARDEAIVRLLKIGSGTKVGLIGVVNPLVAAIKARGGVCLPCDFNMERTQDGQAVVADMTTVLEEADMLLITGMTLGNGSFDAIISAACRRGIPLVAYAQTGSAILPRFLGHGLTALSAEPFPFSHFSGDPTPIHLYRHDDAG